MRCGSGVPVHMIGRLAIRKHNYIEIFNAFNLIAAKEIPSQHQTAFDIGANPVPVWRNSNLILDLIFYALLILGRIRPLNNCISIIAEFNDGNHTFGAVSILRIAVYKFLGCIFSLAQAGSPSARNFCFHTAGNIHYQYYSCIRRNFNFFQFVLGHDFQIHIKNILRICGRKSFLDLDFALFLRNQRIGCIFQYSTVVVHHGILPHNLTTVIARSSVLSRSIQIGNAAGKYHAGRQDQRKNLPRCFLQHEFFPFLWILKAYLFIPRKHMISHKKASHFLQKQDAFFCFLILSL